MKNVLGIIAEYNPFHNGHLHHLTESKKITKSEYTIAIMSGNFTQRGNTAILDKWSRTRAALESGVDLVIELPLLYSISSAENFAEGAIKILDSLKIVNCISFGAETEDINTLSTFANVLYKEPKKYRKFLSDQLSTGVSFPKARENALALYLGTSDKFTNVLSSPNNILGVEYLKALKKYKSKLTPYSIKRFNADYHDLESTDNIASATAIRNIFNTKQFSSLKSLVPESTFLILMEKLTAGQIIPDISVFEKQIIHLIRSMSTDEIATLADVSEGLEFAIKNAANSCNTVNELIDKVKSKRYTSTRITRILLYTLLNITKNDIQISKKVPHPYVRVLGFNKKGKLLISEIAKANPKLEIITSVKKFMDSTSNKNFKMMFEKDIWATNVYTIGYTNNSKNNLDYTEKIVII